MALENTIQSAIIRYLNNLPYCICENVKGVAGCAGRPDINACYRGRLLRIEVKSADHRNVPTKQQKANLRAWGHAGAVAVAAYSLDEVKYLFEASANGSLACDEQESLCEKCPINKRKYCYVKRRP